MLCSDIIISAAALPQEKIGMKELGNSLMIGFLEADTVNISVPDPSFPRNRMRQEEGWNEKDRGSNEHK